MLLLFVSRFSSFFFYSSSVSSVLWYSHIHNAVLAVIPIGERKRLTYFHSSKPWSHSHRFSGSPGSCWMTSYSIWYFFILFLYASPKSLVLFELLLILIYFKYNRTMPKRIFLLVWSHDESFFNFFLNKPIWLLYSSLSFSSTAWAIHFTSSTQTFV